MYKNNKLRHRFKKLKIKKKKTEKKKKKKRKKKRGKLHRTVKAQCTDRGL